MTLFFILVYFGAAIVITRWVIFDQFEKYLKLKNNVSDVRARNLKHPSSEYLRYLNSFIDILALAPFELFGYKSKHYVVRLMCFICTFIFSPIGFVIFIYSRVIKSIYSLLSECFIYLTRL